MQGSVSTMASTKKTGFHDSVNGQLWRQRIDFAMSICVAAYALFALALGIGHDRLGLTLLLVMPVVGIGVACYMFAAGERINRLIYPVLLMALVAVHIQVGEGRLEYHFGVFLTLGILMAYRHWQPLVVGAGTIILHHLAFNSMQRAGLPVYCLPQPDFGTVLLHAGYVLAQAGVEIKLAMDMRKSVKETDELCDMVAGLNVNNRVNLAVIETAAATDAGQVLRSSLNALGKAMGAAQNAVSAIAGTSAQIAHGASELNASTDQSARSVQESVGLLTQLNKSVDQSTTSARQAYQVAANASTVAERGGKVVDDMVITMTEINSSAKKIGEIIGVIDSIAFQTNMLALNAAVEAARAGEHGKGFAVVADEVGNLAKRSAQSAREIKSLIGASVERMDQGMTLAESAGATMHEVMAAVKRVDDMIRQIEMNSRAQQQDIGQINSAIKQLDAVARKNLQLATGSASASEALRQQTRGLTDALACFNLEDETNRKHGGSTHAVPAELPHTAQLLRKAS